MSVEDVMKKLMDLRESEDPDKHMKLVKDSYNTGHFDGNVTNFQDDIIDYREIDITNAQYRHILSKLTKEKPVQADYTTELLPAYEDDKIGFILAYGNELAAIEYNRDNRYQDKADGYEDDDFYYGKYPNYFYDIFNKDKVYIQAYKGVGSPDDLGIYNNHTTLDLVNEALDKLLLDE